MRGFGTDECRREIEVVVVEEHSGIRLPRELLDDGAGEGAVDGDVALLPRACEIAVRIAPKRPESVLDEPEHGVRDHVANGVVGGRRVVDEPQAIA